MTKETEVTLKSAGVDLAEYKRVETIYTDPSTVIAIVETGIKVYNMFKRKKSGSGAELQYLRKICAEIRDMQKDLNMIINLLHDLKVHMDQRQIEFISNTLSSKINTVNLFLIGWLETGKGNLEEQFASIHEAKHLLGIYGFAHIHVYMLAFQKELDLCYWLEKGRNFTETLLEESRSYFTDALNASHHLDTPAKRLAEVNKLMADMESKFRKGTFTQDIKIPIKAPKGCWADGYKKSRYTLIIDGNISVGFTFTISETILEKVNPKKEDCRHDPVGPHSPGHIFNLEKSVFEINSPAPTLDAKIKSYNDAHELYLHYLKSKLELTATIYTITQMIEVIDTWFEE